jgi:hypothetical protein
LGGGAVPPKSPFTDSYLLAYSDEHIFYEVDHFLWLADLLTKRAEINGPEGIWRLPNILIEGFAVHRRNLIDFLYPTVKIETDILAEQFLLPDEWEKNRTPEFPAGWGALFSLREASGEDAMSEDAADESVFGYELGFEAPTDDEKTNQRHVLARATLLFLVSDSKEFVSAVNRCMEKTGLMAEAARVHSELVSLAGMHDCKPADLIEAIVSPDAKVGAPDLAAVNQAARFSVELKQFNNALEASAQEVCQRIIRFVQSKLSACSSWEWLYTDLFIISCLQVHSAALGADHSEFSFETLTRADIRPTKALHLIKELRDELGHESPAVKALALVEKNIRSQRTADTSNQKRSRAMNGNGGYIYDYVEWFYQNKVLEKSVNSIARDYCESHCTGKHGKSKTDHRSKIQYGIKQAENLLNPHTS